MGTVFNIKARLAALGRTGTDCIMEIQNRGESCSPSQFSDSIHGRYRLPKGQRICTMANKIVGEWEAEHSKENKRKEI